MPSLLSCLGREYRLCAAELDAVLALHGLQPVWRYAPAELAWVDTAAPVQCGVLQAELGGSVKLAHAIEVGAHPLYDVVDEIVDDYLTGDHAGGRLTFGVGVYRVETRDAPDEAQLAELCRELAQHIKRRHAAAGGKARFVPPRHGGRRYLSSAQTAQNRLLEEGVELVVGVDARGRGVVAGRVLSAQSIPTYVQHDAARDDKRFRQGALPQKLARILVNLARQSGVKTLLDPFCGAGTIAGQALLLGLRPIVGDLDPGAVEATRAYLARLRATDPALPEPRVERWDARHVSRKVAPLSVDAVVCEPFLGPPLRSQPTTARAAELAEECRALHLEALAEARTVMRPGGRAVWIAPAWKCAEAVVRTPLARELYLMGFSPLRPCARWGDPATTLVYHRPDQLVRRVIHVLQN